MSHRALSDKYKYGTDFTFCAYVHDEIQTSCRPEIAQDVINIIETAANKAGDFYNFRVPITAAGDQGPNWGATH